MSKYDDILHLSRPKSHRTSMSRESRAVQFAPFAALTGFEDAVAETARHTDMHVLPDAYAAEQINGILLWLTLHPEEGEKAYVTYFVPDEKKEGGTYSTLSGIKKLHPEERTVRMLDGTVIPIDAIVDITGICPN